MKTCICFIFLCLVFKLNAQFLEDFSDGDYTNNPSWIGNTDSFELNNNTLHLNAPANTSESYLSTASNGAVEGYWEFFVNLNFNPSSGNKALVYVISDSANLKGNVNGYFVMIGGTDDEVSLYKQKGTSQIKIIDGIDDFINLSDVNVKVKLTRDMQGNFELFADTSTSLNNYESQGTVFDNEFLSSSYFGVLCDYTSTRSDKFWFDDFTVTTQTYNDVFAPNLISYSILNSNSILLEIDEKLDSTFAIQSNNYMLNNSFNPFQINYLKDSLILNFTQNFSSINQNELTISVKDISNNQLDTNLVFNFNNITYHEVLINEIYADETPSYGMPNYEFIELKNNTSSQIIIDNWKIADATDTALIPNDTLQANEYLILCKSAAFNDYSALGKTIAVSSFPSLNNSSDNLKLLNKFNEIIDSLSYNNTWYRAETDNQGNDKKSGGYSLERIAENNPCSDFYNWFPSLDTLGATPGIENSVVNYSISTNPIEITDITIENDTTLVVSFNQLIPFITQQNCNLSNNVIEQVYNDLNQLYVLIQNPLNASEIYTLSFENIIDCYGNSIPNFSKDFYKYENPTADDLVINEILFNPKTGGSDYLELYNKSDKVILLKDFQIIEYDVFEPNIKTDSVVIASNIEIEPNSFVLLTEDTLYVLENYNVTSKKLLFENNLPNFNDDESIVSLRLPDGSLIDSLYYNKSWHFELLDVQDGVSLERVDVLAETNTRNNWHSAAKTYGYGTPTTTNSQVYTNNLEENVSINPEVITPNEDGIDDFCLINYNTENANESITIKIYDAQGREVKLLAQNHSVGSTNTWKWNGTNNNLEKAPIGIYIILFEITNIEGKTSRIKRKLVLGTRLN